MISCCQQPRSQSDAVGNVGEGENISSNIGAQEYDSSLNDVLIKSGFSIQERASLDISHSPLAISQDFKLINLEDINVRSIFREVWISDEESIELWLLYFSDKGQFQTIKNRFDSLCNAQSSRMKMKKAIFRKNFRNYKLYQDILILIKHKLYSDEQKLKHQALIHYLSEGFSCW
jgi:hypothetical protein